MKMIRSVCLLFFVSAMLAGCATTAPDPNAPQLTDEEKQLIAAQRYVDNSLIGVRAVNIYIGIKSDEWPDEKVTKYRDRVAIAKAALSTMQELIDVGDIRGAESKMIIVDGFLDALEEAYDVSPKEQPT